ncbi:MAG TPA: PadR family transcriptional regulator [Luteitalea sp.]|nr:PadR family transcriptional regulator [Luteitalea sp.]
MADSRSDLLQGTLDLLILKICGTGPVHGYAISQRLRARSEEVLQVQQGSLYPALHRLERKGLLKATWDTTDTGREAKFYQLTAAGRKQLDSETAYWMQMSRAIALVLQTAD